MSGPQESMYEAVVLVLIIMAALYALTVGVGMIAA